jgi:hypothetical protein
MMDDWPFDQPPNCATISLRQIVSGGERILHVTHDEDDHGWQFLGWGDAQVEDGVVVCLSHILELDPSVREVADLPPGWHAWRQAVGQPWTREPRPPDDPEA